MSEQPDDATLIARAQAGERLAFERLLVRHQRPLTDRIRRRIPARLRHLLDEEDILQETFVDGWEGISSFRPAGEGAFFGWVARIADNRILDCVKAFRAAKRGGDRQRVVPGPDVDLADLLAMLAVNPKTPSRSVANREALGALQAAIPTLKADYRDVLRLRFIEEASVDQTARQMNRTEWAVQKLTARALEALREAMGGVSRFLSRK
jgi:RNA polymerase sigma-70 factor (ECF subfamily)